MAKTSLGIGYDTSYELNEFGQPRIRSEIELIVDIVLFVLFAKPGNYPSIPWIGLDINTMLYSFYDEIDENDLKTKIIQQCNALGVFFDNDIINIKKTMYKKQPSLFIHINGKASYPDGYMKNTENGEETYLIGITYDEFNNMVYNINNQGGGR